ncbi:MAG: hypothetical protein AUG89_04440 [Acidobacteria bacterium 13_1_20CM_4_56_7]|nr:MAG: hypothetical protein AUG89_04440 [Acidobacteria bacterium 13_1_20CM_4_56_7]
MSAAGLALNPTASPTSSERSGPGRSETPVGGTSGLTFVGLLLPQDGKSAQATIKKPKDIAEKNFPMKPFKKEWPACSGKLSV